MPTDPPPDTQSTTTPTDLTTDTQDIKTATNGHFQIVVPDFATAAPAGKDAAVPLSSFIRLGTASTTAAGAESDPASTYGATLLNVALHSSPIAAGNLVNDGLVVGDTSAIFADDIRDQGADNHANQLTPAQRVAESNVLLTKGGWRDHTDGNRITTTYGDKVEVIRGNLKMVVLGRQDAVGNGLTWDSSGGMLQDNDAAPGQVTEISWVESGGGTWRVVETCTKGDVDTTYDGKVVERFVGGSMTTIVGREDKATVATPIDYPARLENEWKDAIQNGYIDAALSKDDYAKQRGYYNKNDYALGGTASSGTATPYALPAGGNNPFVLEQTWASRIESYTGSEKAPVPDIIETTHAGTITETTYADSVTSKTTVTGTISETTSAKSLTNNTTVSGTISETMTANLVDRKFYGNVHEYNSGGKWETVLGGWGAFRLGASLELFIGVGAEINLGPALEMNVGFSLGIATTTVDIVKTAIENDTVEIKFQDLSLKRAACAIGTFGLYVCP